jgi:tyrosyl-tRNA synthetase
MNTQERLNLIKRNTEEIVTEEELTTLLKSKKQPIVYCGYEPSGPMHLGHLVTITKLLDLQEAGFAVKILLADVHASLNRKGEDKDIKKSVDLWKKTIKALKIKAEVILGSDFQFTKEYQLDVMRLAQHSTIHRGLKSMQEIARDVDNATISQLWYPLMQVADIKHLGVDIALGGMEQRKVHMIGKDESKTIDYPFIALHTPLITSLKGPGSKMSKSIPGSGISVTDTYDEIKNAITNAYCPMKETRDNPVMQLARLIVFPRIAELNIKRPAKFGGNLSYKDYDDLESDYTEGKVHPTDLKNAIIEELEKIIAPVRKNFK